MRVNVPKNRRQSVSAVISVVLGLSSFGVVGCVHSSGELFSGRSERIQKRFATRTDGRPTSDLISRAPARGLNDDETTDPFLREERRTLTRNAVQNASQRTATDRESRRAELASGAQDRDVESLEQRAGSQSGREPEPPPNRNITGPGERPSGGRNPTSGRALRIPQRNYGHILDQAMAETEGSDQVEMLPSPPENVAADASDKPPRMTSNATKTKHVRPIPDDAQIVSANRAASVEEMPQARVTGAALLRLDPNPPQPVEPPFVVRIRPAVPEAVVAAENSQRIARVNANQAAHNISALKQSFHTEETPPASESTTLDSSPTSARESTATTSLPAYGPNLSSPSIDLRTSVVQLDRAVESDDEPVLPAVEPVDPTAMISLPPTPVGPETVALGPKLSNLAVVSAPAIHRSAQSVDESKPNAEEGKTRAAASQTSIWIWLGGLCGACGLFGLLVFSRLERRRYAPVASLKWRRTAQSKRNRSRHQPISAVPSVKRRAA